jgi:hypothetical protein
MKAKITKIILLLSVVVLSGCLSTNPDKAQRTISHWIPPGTPQEDAIRIMKQHGFESGKDEGRLNDEGTVFWFSRETKILKNMWWFYVHFKNGKVVSIDRLGTGNDFFGPHEIPSGG